jgi:hypothetical protein
VLRGAPARTLRKHSDQQRMHNFICAPLLGA